MVKTKSVNVPVEESDGTRILVTRYPVRFKRHEPPFIMEWARDVSPSDELLRAWKPTDHQAILMHHLSIQLPSHMPITKKKTNEM